MRRPSLALPAHGLCVVAIMNGFITLGACLAALSLVACPTPPRSAVVAPRSIEEESDRSVQGMDQAADRAEVEERIERREQPHPKRPPDP
jgi:hypothetical protein